MAFPQVAAVNGGNNTSETTDHTVNLPADINAGDLLLVFFVCDAFSVADVITFPEGWTKLFQADHSARIVLGVGYRVADGEEGATINVTTSSTETSAHTSYRITGYSGVPEAATAATNSGSAPNPPHFFPSWGAKDALWFACEGNDHDHTVTDYPSEFTDGRNDYAIADFGCGVGTARREFSGDDLDPGAFTISSSDDWVANTVVIQPEEVVVRRIFITHT